MFSMKNILLLASSALALLCASCANEPERKPIRPVSDNSQKGWSGSGEQMIWDPLGGATGFGQ